MSKTIYAGRKKKIAAPKKINKTSFPIVAIGASAGGLEAVSQLLKYLPADTGMAFFYVQHLSPDHPSNLPFLLARSTKMNVLQAKNGLKIERNNVYVCAPNKEMTLAGDKIKLTTRHSDKLPYLPINDFFTLLAAKYKKNVIGIILSGNATDGTDGLKAIKEAGGLTFAQDGSAKYSSMPKSAINKSVVDFILSPKEIALRLKKLAKNGFKKSSTILKQKEHHFADNDPDLKNIFEILHKETGVDFSHYKMSTISRRLSNRMLHSGAKSIKEYVKLLHKNNDEADMFRKDLLINVTGFFRDEETFRYLKSKILPKLLNSKPSDGTLRIWVAACSTGEEAYSIAMLIAELQDNKTKKIPVQIFATDLSEHAIRNARIGKFSQNDLKHLTKDRLNRFFTKAGDHYHIVKELRKICMFSPHNILHDPPFSRMDFISCRNLLIYFDASAQKKALASLSFALNDSGYLMLGKSETIGISSQFTQVNNNFKIYSRKKQEGLRKVHELKPRFPRTTTPGKKINFAPQKNTSVDSKELDSFIDSVLLARYMPACAIINKDMEILKFRGSTSLYLSHPSGNASLNILKMTRPEFAFELRSAIHKALKTKQTVLKQGIEIKIDSDFRMMSLEVFPLKIEWNEPLLLIVFNLQEQVEKYIENGKDGKNIPLTAGAAQKDRKIKKLKEELSNTRSEMHSIIEWQETAYEELQAANEEIVSTNEEFQTLNEELETTKEEIEATNEELISTNNELQMRNDLLTESYKYSEAIIATIHEPMIILDSKLHVKSANKAFYKKFRVTEEETEGIYLYQLDNKQWNIVQLRELLQDIISRNVDFKNFEIKHTFPGIGEKIMLLNAHRIIQKSHDEQLILLAIEDITERTHHYLLEKETLNKDIRAHKADKLELEKAVRRRTKQLENKNIELENANKDLISFTYVSSHDLQEPLRKIKNFISVLLEEEEKKLSNDGKKYLQRTYETAQRMQALIEDLITYSRTKNPESKFEKTNLNIILGEVKKEYEDLIKEKKANIEAGKLGEINVIPFQFHQLLQNLIGNSLKFSKSGKSLRITIKSKIAFGSKLNKENSTSKVELSPKIKYCHITYTDNGIGFDPQYNERIFEVFQRLHGHEEYRGTGMGLAICKRIVENHKGFITANGALNKGAKFDIYIPV